MNTIVATVLKSTAEESQADIHPFNLVALFCGVGLVASLCLAALGLDVSGGIF
jgi:tRNA/tmRNA/rRNA uracil-C5-methylase (TrmA/RlmC/RlmD family)